MKHGCTCKMMGASLLGTQGRLSHMYMGWGLGKVCLKTRHNGYQDSLAAPQAPRRNAQVLQPSVNALQKTGADRRDLLHEAGAREIPLGRRTRSIPPSMCRLLNSLTLRILTCVPARFSRVSSPAAQPSPALLPALHRDHSWVSAQRTVLQHLGRITSCWT